MTDKAISALSSASAATDTDIFPVVQTMGVGPLKQTNLAMKTYFLGASTAALAIASGKTLTVSNSLTFTGTDSTSFAFPSGSDTVVTLGATQTLTNKTLVAPALGTPASGVATNLTGTAAGLTAGTVTTNANLTGVITSSGNATSIASQTGTGSKFVVDTSPTLVTPVLGVAAATSINKLTITAPATGSTLTVVNGKTLTVDNTLELTGTDSTVMTFPSTSASVARTDAAQTFTGIQTFSTAIAVGSGGTGAATFAANGILYGNGTSAIGATSVGTSGQVLTSNGTGVAPTFQTTSSAPTGTAGGSLSGTYPNPTVATNANLTGVITSSGNATSIGSQTGTGSKFVVDTSPTLVTPILGVAAATSINKLTITAPATGSTLTILDGKTFSVNNSLTLAGTDSTTMTFPGTSDTVAVLGTAQTFTAAQTSSKAGGSSTPAFLFTGTPFTGSGTTSFPLIYLNGGTAPTNFSTGGTYLGINGTASFGGNFIDVITNGGSHVFTVNAGGSVTSGNTITSGTGFNASSGGLAIAGTFAVTFTGRGILSSPGGGSIQLGSSDAASPVAQTLGPQNVVTGTSNTAGQNWIIRGSRGTGTGVGGNINLQVAPAGTTGSTVNTLVTALTIHNAGAPVLPNYSSLTWPAAATVGAGARIYVTDALTPAFGVTITGGSSTGTPAYSDGTNWRAG